MAIPLPPTASGACDLAPGSAAATAADRVVAVDRCFSAALCVAIECQGRLGSQGVLGLLPEGPRARGMVAERRCRGRGPSPMLRARGARRWVSATTTRCCRYVSPGPACGAWWPVSGFPTGCSRRSACLRAGSFWPSFLIVPGSVACSRPTGLRRGPMPSRTPRCMRWPGLPAATGLMTRWDGARWWSREHKMMVVFGFGSYRLAKVCVRGICSAVSGDDILFMHGCALSVGAGTDRRGVVITGSSGAGKTTLVAGLLRHPEYAAAVLNDDWGAISLSRGDSVSTGERMLHMKTGSVLALRPGFFTSAPAGSYSRDLSERDRAARMLVSPESVYGRHGAPRRRWWSMWPWLCGSPRTGCRPAGKARR